MNTIKKEFAWDSRYAKRHVDDMMFGLMRNDIGRLRWCRVLSLPAADLVWEQMLASYFKDVICDFTCIERDAEVFRAMLSKTRTLKNKLDPCIFKSYKMDVKDYFDCSKFRLKASRFHLVYLDFMGTWGRDKYDCLAGMFASGALADHSYLRTTFQANRGHGSIWESVAEHVENLQVWDLRPEGDPIADWKMYGIPGIIVDLARAYGIRMKPVKAAIYRSQNGNSGRPVPQITFLFKRV